VTHHADPENPTPPPDISSLQSALETYLTGPEDRPDRFQRGLELRDDLQAYPNLEEDHTLLRLAVELDCRLLDACPSDDPGRPAHVEHCVRSLTRQAAHPQTDLAAAILLARVLNADPQNERAHRATREGLADLLVMQHARAGDGRLKEAVSLLRENLAMLPASDPARAALCIKLARALVARESEAEAETETETAGGKIRIVIIVRDADADADGGADPLRPPAAADAGPGSLLHEALRLHPPGHPEHAATTAAVARVVDAFPGEQYMTLDKRVLAALGDALLTAPHDDAEKRARSLRNSATMLAPGDDAPDAARAEKAVALYLAALRLGAEDRDELCSNVSDLLWAQSSNAPGGRPAPDAATRTIVIRRELLAALSPEGKEYPYSQGFLALALVQHPEHTPADRAEARELLRDAVRGVRTHHPNYEMFLDMRARLLAAHYEETKDAAVLAELREAESAQEFAKGWIGRGITKFKRVHAWIRFLSRLRSS
jgi:hypothetical protein